jgi:hypothetical protein
MSEASRYISNRSMAELLGSEVSRNTSCSLNTESPPVIEISNHSGPEQIMGLLNLLDNLQVRLGQTRKDAIRNKDLIKFVINNYLKANPQYTDEGKPITVDTHSFLSNGIVLLGNDEQKKQTEELKRQMPYINWSVINGIIGVGLVHMYSWWIHNAGMGLLTGADLNVPDVYVPQAGMQTDLFAPGPLPTNFEPYSLI